MIKNDRGSFKNCVDKMRWVRQMSTIVHTANIYRMVIGNFICYPLSAYRILPIGTNTVQVKHLSAKGITDQITDNHPIDICSACKHSVKAVKQDTQLYIYIVKFTYARGQRVFSISTWARSRQCTKCPQKSMIGRQVVKIGKKLVHVVCERPLILLKMLKGCAIHKTNRSD